jgi:hypothetical protein
MARLTIGKRGDRVPDHVCQNKEDVSEKNLE